MTRQELALELRSKGYNCCQCTACAFAKDMDVDYVTVFKAAEALGSGLGGMKGVCGALSGAAMVIGLKNSTANLEAPDSKAASCRLSRELTDKFQEKAGSIICREIKGVETGKMLHSCPDCIKDAVTLTEEILGL